MNAIRWQIATVKATRPETLRARTLTLSLPEWTAHKAGQHYDLRLTAEDGYQALRSYSIASEPERVGEIDLTVERLQDGEVSPYLHEVLVDGDQVEVRGPIGGYFVWEAALDGSVLLVAGGSGIVPLMAMLRHRRAAGSSAEVCLLYSTRTPQDVIYAQELDEINRQMDGVTVLHTFTRQAPEGWTGFARRIDRPMLEAAAAPLGRQVRAFVCGPTLLVEGVSAGLVELGLAPSQIKTERFGPSGGTG